MLSQKFERLRLGPLRPERVRAFAIQFLFMALVVWAIYALMLSTQANLEVRGVDSGFEFLEQRAGFPISVSLIEYTPNDSYGRAFLVGAINTVYTAIICIILATIIGVVMGVAQVSGNLLIAKLAEIYVEIFRNIPVLLILLFFYGVVLAGLPSVRQAIEFFPGGFLTQRGIFIPRPVPLAGFNLVIASMVKQETAVNRPYLTGYTYQSGSVDRITAHYLSGRRATTGLGRPGAEGVQLQGRFVTDAGICCASGWAFDLSGRLYRRKRSGRHYGRVQGPD